MQKSWTWSTTGLLLTKKSHEEIIEICQAAGLAGIEGGAPLFDGLRDSELEAIGEKYRDAGLQIETFHLPFSAQLDLVSFYEQGRRSASSM